MTRSRGILPRRRFWTSDEDAQLRALYPDQASTDIARQLGRPLGTIYQRAQKLGLKKSEAYLASPAACRLRRGDNVGAAHRFMKGQRAHNEGLRRPGYSQGRGRMQETQFKKGERSGLAVKLYQPIGAERINADGYRDRKVNDDLPLQKRWRAVHLILWEAANGPIPSGHAVRFLNGDKTDIRLENLEMISRQDMMRRNTVHNLPPELAQTVQLLGALNRKIRRRSREKQD